VQVSVSSGVATSASAETRRGLVPDFKLEASPQVASGPSLRPSFLQRFSGSMVRGRARACALYSQEKVLPQPRATEVSQSDFDVLDRLKEQKKRIEREFADAERRRNELERLQREDPFKAARFLEREEKKRQRTAPHDDGGDVSRPTSEKKPREKKRTSPSRRASTGNEDVVGFKANMSAAVMAALKPFLVANRIADKESLKFLCRKLCKSLVEKETERGNYGRWHAKMGPAAVKFVEAHMAKLAARGEVYRYVEGEAHAPRAAPHSNAAPGVASGAPPPQLQPPQLYDPFAM